MTNIISSPTVSTARLDRALEYAVIQSWDELMPDPTSGSIQVEYQTGADGSLDFLTLWASTTRGHWSLISEFWMRPLWSHATGLRFGDDYHSETFARTLEFVVEHEGSYAPDQHGLIQIYPPTPEKRSEAERWRTVAFDDQGSSPTKVSVAA
jgi:hypothetical protein